MRWLFTSEHLAGAPSSLTSSPLPALGRVTERYLFAVRANEVGPDVSDRRHDTRFLGEEFAAECAQIVVQHGFDRAALRRADADADRFPCDSSQHAVCGINFTASHNPPEYSGMKLSTADGARRFRQSPRESRISGETGAENRAKSAPQQTSAKLYPRDAYLADLEQKIRFDVISRPAAATPTTRSGEPAAAIWMNCYDITASNVKTIHDWRDVLFGGRAPGAGSEPSRRTAGSGAGGKMCSGISHRWRR